MTKSIDAAIPACARSDRRRAVLGERLRRSVKEVEDAEFQVIERTPAKGKKAA